MITRRAVISGVPAAAVGMSMLNLDVPFLSAQTAQALSQAMLNTVTESVGTALTNITNGVGKVSDYQAIHSNTATLISNMVAANSDVAFKAAAKQVAYSATTGKLNNMPFTASSLSTAIYNGIKPYAPNMPYSTIYNQVLAYGPWPLAAQYQAANINGHIAALANGGSLPWLNKFQSAIEDYIIDPEDPEGDGSCTIINALFWFLGLVFAVLWVMCTIPEPAIVVICPIAGIIAGLLAIVAAMIPVVCGL